MVAFGDCWLADCEQRGIGGRESMTSESLEVVFGREAPLRSAVELKKGTKDVLKFVDSVAGKHLLKVGGKASSGGGREP